MGQEPQKLRSGLALPLWRPHIAERWAAEILTIGHNNHNNYSNTFYFFREYSGLQSAFTLIILWVDTAAEGVEMRP